MPTSAAGHPSGRRRGHLLQLLGLLLLACVALAVIMLRRAATMLSTALPTPIDVPYSGLDHELLGESEYTPEWLARMAAEDAAEATALDPSGEGAGTEADELWQRNQDMLW